MDQNQNPYTQPDFNQTNQPQQANMQNQQPQYQQPYQQSQYQQAQPYQQAQQPYQQAPQQPYQQPGYQQPYQQPNYQQQMPASGVGFDQSYQAPVYPSGVAVKKRINPLAIIIPAAVVVIAAVVILIILLSGKSDYRKAEQNFFNNTFGRAFSSAEGAAEKLKSQSEYLKVEFETPSGSLDIPNFSVEANVAPNGDKSYSEISFSMEDVDLDIQGWVDSAEQTIHIFFPEISDIYAKYDLGKLISEASLRSEDIDFDYEKYSDAMDRIMSRVSDKYFELVGDPEIEKNQSFNLEGKSYDADKCVIELDAKELMELLKTIFEAVTEDDELLGLIADVSEGQYSVSEIRSELNDMLDSFDDSLSEINEDDFALEMSVYMNGNNIIGREIKVKVSGLNAVSLSFYDIPTSDGRVVAFKTGSDALSLMNSMSAAAGEDAAVLPMMSYGSGSNDAALALLDMTFILEDTAKGDVHSGTATLRAGTVFSAKLEYNDLALTENLCQGEASLTISDMPAYSVDLELSKDGDNKVIDLDITNVCSITLIEGPSDLKYKELPDIPDSKLAEIDPNSNQYDNETLQQLTEDLGNALGGYNY